MAATDIKWEHNLSQGAEVTEIKLLDSSGRSDSKSGRCAQWAGVIAAPNPEGRQYCTLVWSDTERVERRQCVRGRVDKTAYFRPLPRAAPEPKIERLRRLFCGRRLHEIGRLGAVAPRVAGAAPSSWLTAGRGQTRWSNRERHSQVLLHHRHSTGAGSV